jgi:hypothetical protein
LSLVKNHVSLQQALLAIGCLSLGCSDPSCEDLARDAWAAIQSVDGQHLECSVDADCALVPIPNGCWQLPSCTPAFLGNQVSLTAALDRAAKGVARDLCARFEARACTYPAPSCDIDPPRQYQCSEGKCVWISASSP